MSCQRKNLSLKRLKDGPWANDTVFYGYTGDTLTSIDLNRNWLQTVTPDAGRRWGVITSPAGSNAAGALVLSTVATNWLPVTVSFSYDLNGNLVSDGQKSYEGDRANQLTSVTLPGEWRTEYAYDGLGRRRISREYTWRGSWALASEVRYVYDRMLVLQERRADNTVLATYTRGLDLSGSMQGAGGIGGLLARTDSAGSTYYHSDGGGNITSLTDSSGAVVARYLYDPFGRLLGRWGAMAEVNRYQFSSKETDRLTGLSYYGYRFYDPSLQRWLNRDPIGERGGLNLNSYVANNPINEVDPLGLTWSSNWNFFWSWAFGGGQQNRNYYPNAVENQEMQNSPGGNKLRDAFYNNGCKNVNNFGYGTMEAAKDTALHPSQWSSTAFQVGGFGGASAVDNGDGTATFTIQNKAGTESFFGHYLQFFDKSINVPDRSSNTGPMRNIYQNFQWTEPIDKSECKCPNK